MVDGLCMRSPRRLTQLAKNVPVSDGRANVWCAGCMWMMTVHQATFPLSLSCTRDRTIKSGCQDTPATLDSTARVKLCRYHLRLLVHSQCSQIRGERQESKAFEGNGLGNPPCVCTFWHRTPSSLASHKTARASGHKLSVTGCMPLMEKREGGHNYKVYYSTCDRRAIL